MPENLDDFFEHNAQWVSNDSESSESYDEESDLESEEYSLDSDKYDKSDKSDKSDSNNLQLDSDLDSDSESDSEEKAKLKSAHSKSSKSKASHIKSSHASKGKKSMKSKKSKRKRRTRAVIITIVIALIFCIAGYGFAKIARSIMNPQEISANDDWPGPGEGSVDFTVEVGEGANSIGSKLVKQGIVKSQAVFASVVSANNKILYPGIYKLKKHMSSMDVVDILSDRTKATGFLEVQAGQRSTDIIRKAAEISGVDYSKFKEIINAKGAGILPPEANGSFEGWLEPGNYNVKQIKDAKKILSAMVNRRIEKLDALKVPKGNEREKVLKIASIAEAEVNTKEYYGKVVRVILNRLDKNMPLGMDTTVAYGIGIKAIELRQSQLDDANNKYNTRIHKGLPPTPISIPGDNAIYAALNPKKGPWLYFVTTDLKTGETKFANNYKDFVKIRDEYKRNNKDAN